MADAITGADGMKVTETSSMSTSMIGRLERFFNSPRNTGPSWESHLREHRALNEMCNHRRAYKEWIP